MRSCESLTTIVFVLLLSVVKSVRDFPGSYCAAKYPSGRCCPGRQDECNAPIHNTLCYCDDFCNRSSDDDCCPDFWSHCGGVNVTTTSAPEEIRRCFFQGRYYNINETLKDNCNKCKCIPMGRDATVYCEKDRCLVDDPDNIFWGTKLEEAKFFLGCDEPSEIFKQMKCIRRIFDPDILPREFDARKHWPGYISGVVDQGKCSSSWVRSVASIASDRFAIMSKGVERVDLSAQHLISCNMKNKGCEKGQTEIAWKFVKKFGLVDEACYPYTSGNGIAERCKLERNTTLKEAGCAPPPNPLRTELYKVGPTYRLCNENDIMYDILTWGPVQAIMMVYRDLFNYVAGTVYRHDRSLENDEIELHAVRIIGWGEESSFEESRKFWLVTNSWGEKWGDRGLFKIERGTNESGIEMYVVGAYAKTI
ncbi:tubulointerstitial nephritis antigen-like [Hylaeus anthracinus]|uniref:tubulointerstitial nephritis antigen-like n=1 Tax=Hylaeus anthracinus TaxID=313031 RepID=UPI0023B96A05|nr:tubulointerstitial nephritis antigen-like [Hylaeus anthracinus]XP_054003705.1 tubulointerstitial nephritis antigen-like [Hylaeus anthracinus]XP_054003706.1 tubulointerstitial nephritis antigen-like [Hylaeus anthracinus]